MQTTHVDAYKCMVPIGSLRQEMSVPISPRNNVTLGFGNTHASDQGSSKNVLFKYRFALPRECFYTTKSNHIERMLSYNVEENIMMLISVQFVIVIGASVI